MLDGTDHGHIIPTPEASSSELSPNSDLAVTGMAIKASRKRPTPRKGHTKSRRGCLNCKRRRVKCPETLPECDHCRRLGMACEYPAAGTMIPAPTNALRATPTQFSMEDLRFFQHFLLNAYPPLPIKGDAVWKEVAALSHSFDYLIHAMLGLAASHLALSNGADYSSQALTHRVESINSLNRALDNPCVSKAEGDARFATVMALTFQSSYMHEGMLEFLSMVRGCMVVSGSAMPCFEESAFRSFSTEEHEKAVRSLSHGPLSEIGDESELDSGIASIRAVGPLCQSTLEVRYLAALESMLKTAKTSYFDAITDVTTAYNMFGEASNEEFNLFANRSNYAAQIILAHFFVIEYMLLSPVLQPVQDSFPFRRIIVAAWVRQVADALPNKYKGFLSWPLRFPDSMRIVQI